MQKKKFENLKKTILKLDTYRRITLVKANYNYNYKDCDNFPDTVILIGFRIEMSVILNALNKNLLIIIIIFIIIINK